MKYLLYPFAILYDIITSIRNRLYDLGYKPSAAFEIPVIVVGNLAVGGTGKTPMVEYLIRLLRPTFKVATLSRGYGRSTKGFRIVTANDNAGSVGDEPFQLYRKFDAAVPVAVGEERAMAIPLLLHDFELDALILDDAFQHRRVKGSFYILLTDYSRPFYKDFLLPAGRLREARVGAARTDVVVVTKCPDLLQDEERMQIENEIRKYTDKPVFFSCIRYGLPLPLNHDQPFVHKIVLLSGIANATGFEQYALKHFEMVKHFAFADHHTFSADELREVVTLAKQQHAVVLTTEKDATRLQPFANTPLFEGVPIFYLPIEAEFLKNGEDFDEMVFNAVQVHHESGSDS